MVKLETKNAELGGRLFGVFGVKTPDNLPLGPETFPATCFIFKTPITKEAPNIGYADEFLVVTEEGFRLIRVNKGASLGEGQRPFKDLLADHIKYVQTHQQQPDEARSSTIDYRHDAGYVGRDGILLPPSPDLLKLDVSHPPNKNLIGWRGTVYGGLDLSSVRLVDKIDPDAILEIIQVNIERAETERADEEARKEERRLQEKQISEQPVDPNLIVAQRLGEVLG